MLIFVKPDSPSFCDVRRSIAWVKSECVRSLEEEIKELNWNQSVELKHHSNLLTTHEWTI